MLNNPDRIEQLRRIILGKPSLRKFYIEVYHKYARSLMHCPQHGLAIELGSGGGFVKDIIPDLITTDILPYRGIDQVVDATVLPYPDNSLRFIGMLNVFHHIPDALSFFREVQRCLLPGGRVFMVDQHPGWLSFFILKYLHHEPFNPQAVEWSFEGDGPLSGANGALAWIVFRRDVQLFQKLFPKLSLLQYRPHTPLWYWLAGGLKNWCLLPVWIWSLATFFDRALISLSGNFGSFVDVELVKTNSHLMTNLIQR